MADKMAIFNELRRRGVFSARQEAIIKTLEDRGELETNLDKIVGSLSAQKVKEEQQRSAQWKKRAGEYRAEAEELPKRLAAEQGPVKAALIGAGKGFVDVGRGIARATPFYSKEDFAPDVAQEEKYYGELKRQRPYSTTLGEIAGETAAIAPIGGAAAGLARVGKLGQTAMKVAQLKKAQPLLTGAAAAGEAALAGGGRGESGSEIAVGAGAAALGGTAAHMAMPKLIKAGGEVFRRLTGKAPKGSLITKTGQPTPELSEALQATGIDFEDFSEESLDLLKKQEVGADPEQAARLAAFEELGFKGETAPTQAHLRRTATGFQQQQEALKKSGLVRDRLENINKRADEIFEEAVNETGGKAQKLDLKGPEKELVSDVYSHIVGKSTALDKKIGEMYNIAREVTGDEAVIDPKTFFKRLNEALPENDLAKGLPAAIESVAKRRDIIDADGNMRKITATEAERLVQSINKRYTKSDKNQNRVARMLKDAIDDDVLKSGGGDLYKQARKAKAEFHRGLERVNASRYSKRDFSLVKNILEEKITPDEVFEKGVLSKSSKSGDIRDLKNYLKQGTAAEKKAGKAAWDNLRAETLQYIKDEAFKGATGEKELGTITRNKLDNAIKKIGIGKLKQILEPQELALLHKMRKVVGLMEPVSGTERGLGPSAQAVRAGWESIKNIARKVPMFGAITDDISFDATRGMLRSRPDVTKAVDETELTKKLGALGTGIAAGKFAKEESR